MMCVPVCVCCVPVCVMLLCVCVLCYCVCPCCCNDVTVFPCVVCVHAANFSEYVPVWVVCGSMLL